MDKKPDLRAYDTNAEMKEYIEKLHLKQAEESQKSDQLKQRTLDSLLTRQVLQKVL